VPRALVLASQCGSDDENQLRVARQVPLQRSPVMMPLQEPVPLVPASRPPPLALEAPTDTLTATAPMRLTEPETRPPPADDTRLPATWKGTL
jgi:hypothetical protein